TPHERCEEGPAARTGPRTMIQSVTQVTLGTRAGDGGRAPRGNGRASDDHDPGTLRHQIRKRASRQAVIERIVRDGTGDAWAEFGRSCCKCRERARADAQHAARPRVTLVTGRVVGRPTPRRAAPAAAPRADAHSPRSRDSAELRPRGRRPRSRRAEWASDTPRGSSRRATRYSVGL